MSLSDRTPPATVAYKKVDDALALLDRLPKSPGLTQVVSALVVARGRMQHLERRLSETETMRDRIALRMLPAMLADNDWAHDSAIERAYALADQMLEFRANEAEEFGVRFRAGEWVRLKRDGREGLVDSVDATGDPVYVSVNFDSSTGTPTVCLASELERVKAK